MLQRPWFIVALAALCLISTEATAEPLNVLFVVADDLNCSLGCYGSPDVSSPNIDSLARRGLRFDRAYCQQAVCNPSRTSVLTGLRPDTVRVWDLRANFRSVRPDHQTLPQLFKENGYTSRCIGKIFHNMGDLSDDEHSWSTPPVLHAGRHSDEYVLGEVKPGQHPKARGVLERGDVPDEAYRDGQIAAKAVETLGELKDQPFFLAVGFWRPHLPLLAPEPYWARYDDRVLSLPDIFAPPKNVPEIALHDSREIRGYGVTEPNQLSDKQRRLLWQGYYAGISYMDAQVGKVLDALDRLELADKTIVIFWSDHGFHLGQHALWCKTSCFELDARVPLIVSVPGKTRGRATDAIVELVDIYPTLAELCSLTPPDDLAGDSLVPLLDAPATDFGDRVALTQHPRPAYYRGKPEAMGYSLRTDQYRYTEWRRWTAGTVVATELYDHSADPAEQHNLAGSPAHADALTQLKSQLADAMQE